MTLSLSRRSLVAGSALVAASFAVGSAASALDGGATCLRPPSAEDEERFRSLCLKCDRCRSACPQGCVRTGTLEDGLLNWRTPVMDFHRGLCDFCGRCEQTCPTGAIRDVDAKANRIGLAVIDPQRCIKCGVCMSKCPFKAVKKA